VTEPYTTVPDVDVSDTTNISDPEIEVNVDIQLGSFSKTIFLSIQTEDFDWDTASTFTLTKTLDITKTFDTPGFVSHSEKKSFTVTVGYDPAVGGTEGFSVIDYEFDR